MSGALVKFAMLYSIILLAAVFSKGIGAFLLGVGVGVAIAGIVGRMNKRKLMRNLRPLLATAQRAEQMSLVVGVAGQASPYVHVPVAELLLAAHLGNGNGTLPYYIFGGHSHGPSLHIKGDLSAYITLEERKRW